jgi:hypothetical protein
MLVTFTARPEETEFAKHSTRAVSETSFAITLAMSETVLVFFKVSLLKASLTLFREAMTRHERTFFSIALTSAKCSLQYAFAEKVLAIPYSILTLYYCIPFGRS